METQELVLVNPSDVQNAVQLFSGGGIDALITGIEAKVRAIALDPSTAAGRDKIRSTAYLVTRTKTALDAEGKKLTEEWRKNTALVNAERRKSEERLEALAAEVRAPLKAFEDRDKLRIAAHEEALQALGGLAVMVSKKPSMSASLLREHLKDFRALYVDRDWEEFAQRAKLTRTDTIDLLNVRIAEREKYEADQAELERLRQEAEARERAEREAAIAAKAAEDARLLAERQAKEAADAEAKRVIEAAETERRRVEAEADRVRMETERAAKEAQARIDAAEAARVAAEKKAADDKRAADEREAKAARDLKAAQEKAEADRIAAEAKAKADAEAAAKREREKIEAERKAEEQKRLKREADARLRAKVRQEIVEDLIDAFNGEAMTAAEVADVLMAGKIRSVAVTI